MDKKSQKRNLSAANISKQALLYLLGLFLIAFGINFSKMSNLGITPVSSIPRVLEVIWGFTLGKMVMLVYIALVLLQIIVLRKNFKWWNSFGILLAIVFGWIVDFTGLDPNAFGHLMADFPRPQNYLVQLSYIFIAVILVALGVFCYLRPRWIPMPAEGLAGAISEKTGKTFGDCKTLVDTGMILVALILQLIFLGGLSSFTGDNVVIREGTVITAVCIGQVVKFLSKRWAEPLEKWIGVR